MTSGIHLTILIGPVLTPVPRVVIDALTSVQVTAGAGAASGFQLTFSLSTRSPLHTLFLVTAGKTPFLRVVLVATVGGTAEVLSDGVVTQQEVAPGSEPGMSELTLNGTDLTTLMDLLPFDGFLFPAMPPEARVGLILLKYAVLGLIPIVIPSLPFEVPDPTDRIPKQEGSDIAYIRRSRRTRAMFFTSSPARWRGRTTPIGGRRSKWAKRSRR